MEEREPNCEICQPFDRSNCALLNYEFFHNHRTASCTCHISANNYNSELQISSKARRSNTTHSSKADVSSDSSSSPNTADPAETVDSGESADDSPQMPPRQSPPSSTSRRRYRQSRPATSSRSWLRMIKASSLLFLTDSVNKVSCVPAAQPMDFFTMGDEDLQPVFSDETFSNIPNLGAFTPIAYRGPVSGTPIEPEIGGSQVLDKKLASPSSTSLDGGRDLSAAGTRADESKLMEILSSHQYNFLNFDAEDLTTGYYSTNLADSPTGDLYQPDLNMGPVNYRNLRQMDKKPKSRKSRGATRRKKGKRNRGRKHRKYKLSGNERRRVNKKNKKYQRNRNYSYRKYNPSEALDFGLDDTTTVINLYPKSMLSTKLHRIAKKYTLPTSRSSPKSSKGKSYIADYDEFGIKSQGQRMALEPRQKGITLDRLEQDFGIRKGRIANTLKKYKSLVTMLIKKDPYKTFYSLITQDWKTNLEAALGLTKAVLKRRGITDIELMQLERVMDNFIRLSNGKAWAGFEYPMNGKIVQIDRKIIDTFVFNTKNNPIDRGTYKWYMTNNFSPLIANRSLLYEEIKSMKEVLKNYRLYELEESKIEQLNSIELHIKSPSVYTPSTDYLIAPAYSGIDSPLPKNAGSKTKNGYFPLPTAAKEKGGPGEAGSNARLEEFKRARNQHKQASAKRINRILKATRKAIENSKRYYEKIQGPIKFFVTAGVDPDIHFDDAE